GIVGATADNNRGLPGICFNCRYLPIKAAPDDSVNIITGGYPGIVYAADMGADVINCSWGSGFRSKFGAEVVAYATINRGAAVVAAAGNDMADKRNWPAAYEAVISVANTTLGDTICCNSTFDYTIDISAPGEYIVSTFGSAGYWTWAGTSAASPVAAGAIGLTKAHFPEYTAAQAAQRVRVTCDDIYDENPGYVDRLGSGRVNMLRALTDPERPSVRIETLRIRDLDGDGILAGGDTAVIDLDLLNYLTPTQALSLKLEVPPIQQGFVMMLSDSVFVGGIETMEIKATPTSFLVELRETLPADLTLALRFVFDDPAFNYHDIEVREQKINTSYLDIRQNALHTTVNSQGNFGFHDFFQQEEGIGVEFNGMRNVLSEGGLMIATAGNRVSDRIRNSGFRDLDFQPLLPVSRQYAPELPPFTSVSRFSDGFSPTPIGVSVTHHSYAFDDSAYQQFVIFRYIIQNNNAANLGNLYAGLFADWDISPLITPARITTRNAAESEESLKVGFTYDVRGLDSTLYGVTLLSDQNFRTYAGDANATNFGALSKFNMLKGDPGDATAEIGVNGIGVDAYQVVGAGPMSLAAGGYDTIAFAVMAGTDWETFQQQVMDANEAYQCRILGKGPLYSFFVGDTLLAIDEPVAFNDLNTNATQWQWDFGDGNSASASNPAHSYTASGQFTVKLTVSNEQCSRVFTRTLTVSPAVSIDPLPSPANLQVLQNAHRIELAGENWQTEWIHLSLRDMQGKIVQKSKLSGQRHWRASIDTQQLASGMYIIEARGGATQMNRKVWIGMR
ncbi:MAG: S8 family serine peptidase, partial [Bacteroidota bacterium]